MLSHGYETAFVICHNGVIYQYVSKEEISPTLHRLYIDEYISQGYSEREAQLNALEELKRNHDIDFGGVVMKKIEPYFLDDSCKIPEYIKQMSKEDRQREIKRLEEEARQKRMQNQKLTAMF